MLVPNFKLVQNRYSIQFAKAYHVDEGVNTFPLQPVETKNQPTTSERYLITRQEMQPAPLYKKRKKAYLL